jgi:hypothetical protein
MLGVMLQGLARTHHMCQVTVMTRVRSSECTRKGRLVTTEVALPTGFAHRNAAKGSNCHSLVAGLVPRGATQTHLPKPATHLPKPATVGPPCPSKECPNAAHTCCNKHPPQVCMDMHAAVNNHCNGSPGVDPTQVHRTSIPTPDLPQ